MKKPVRTLWAEASSFLGPVGGHADPETFIDGHKWKLFSHADEDADSDDDPHVGDFSMEVIHMADSPYSVFEIMDSSQELMDLYTAISNPRGGSSEDDWLHPSIDAL